MRPKHSTPRETVSKGKNIREIARVGEEDSPIVSDPLVKLDGTCGRLCLEVRRNASKSERRGHGYELQEVLIYGYQKR